MIRLVSSSPQADRGSLGCHPNDRSSRRARLRAFNHRSCVHFGRALFHAAPRRRHARGPPPPPDVRGRPRGGPRPLAEIFRTPRDAQLPCCRLCNARTAWYAGGGWHGPPGTWRPGIPETAEFDFSDAFGVGRRLPRIMAMNNAVSEHNVLPRPAERLPEYAKATAAKGWPKR